MMLRVKSRDRSDLLNWKLQYNVDEMTKVVKFRRVLNSIFLLNFLKMNGKILLSNVNKLNVI